MPTGLTVSKLIFQPHNTYDNQAGRPQTKTPQFTQTPQCEETGRLRVSAEDLDEYWSQQQQQQQQPLGSAERAVPLGLWGDDARFNRGGDKLLLFTMNCILHESSSYFVAIVPFATYTCTNEISKLVLDIMFCKI